MRCRALSSGVVVAVMVAVAGLSDAAFGAESPSELLEKAIYTEESVGDLDAAAKLYEKAVAEAKQVEAVAAKAQYRLGLCLLKQGKKEQGIAALRQVVQRFPDQKELVAAAKKRLPAKAGLKLRPPMWGDGEILQYRIQLAGGLDIGTAIYSVEPAQLDGKKIWRFRSRTLAAGRHLASRVDADFETLMPISSTWTIAGASESQCRYEPGKVILTTTAAGVTNTRTIDIDPAPYDNEEGMFVFRCLPMAEKYSTSVPIFASIGAGGLSVGFDVQGKDTVEVPAGKFSCFKVLLPTPIDQTFWFSDDEHRYPVKFEANNVSGPLVKVERLKIGEPRKYADAKFACVLPLGWNVYRGSSTLGGQKADDDYANLLTPDVGQVIVVKTKELAQLTADEKKSPRAWAEKELPEAAKLLKDMKVRNDSWQSLTIGGSQGVSYVADFVGSDGKPMTHYVVCLFGKTLAAKLVADCPKADLDRMKKALQPVIESLEVK